MGPYTAACALELTQGPFSWFSSNPIVCLFHSILGSLTSSCFSASPAAPPASGHARPLWSSEPTSPSRPCAEALRTGVARASALAVTSASVSPPSM